MQPNRIQQNLIAVKNVEKADAYILMAWDGKNLLITEVSEIANEEELEKYVLEVAKQGNDFLRRILKHRLENRRND